MVNFFYTLSLYNYVLPVLVKVERALHVILKYFINAAKVIFDTNLLRGFYESQRN